jgi:ACS family hexuronate transporter-like MFS transporter
MDRSPSADVPSARRSAVRWWFCFIVFSATAILYSDRQFLSLLKSTLAGEIHWTDSQFAAVNSCFLGAYAFGLIFVGRLIDRFGIKIGYAVTIALWSLAALSHTLVTSVGGFMAARIFLGLSESGNFPTAIKAIAQWFPPAERAFASAVFNSGANVGAIVAPLLVAGLLRDGFSWHAPFILAALAGWAWVAVWLLFYAAPAKHRFVSPAELAWIRAGPHSTADSAPAVAWSSLFGYRQTWSFVVAKFLTDPVWFFLLFWLPDFFKKTRHLDIKSSWPHLITVYAIVTVLSLAGGYFPGYLVRKGWSVTWARKTAMFCSALLVLAILFVTAAGNWMAVVLIGLVGAAHQSWSANLFTTVSDMFPRPSVASVVGIGSMAGALGSMLFQYLCGHILDLYGVRHADAGYAALFSYAAFAYLVAFGLQHVLAPRFEPLDLPGPAPVSP